MTRNKGGSCCVMMSDEDASCRVVSDDTCRRQAAATIRSPLENELLPDLPPLDTILMAWPFLSLPVRFQRAGRRDTMQVFYSVITELHGVFVIKSNEGGMSVASTIAIAAASLLGQAIAATHGRRTRAMATRAPRLASH
jgi:hypothetical protein